MLPTSGYFRGVACPAHEKGQCNRPYCHFRHNPKKETSSAVPIQGSSATNEDNDGISNQIKNELSDPSVRSGSVEDSPSCSSTEASSILNSSISGTAQSELLQQLVSEAVKKVLIENPHLASVGVDPSTLIAQTAAEVNPVNSKLKKKYYRRPPDTPSYNPTPIKELNKRKRSGESNEDSPSNAKAAKYVPASLTSKHMISDASENKESGDSELTDFSSAEDEDIDKQNCDFDILEEVLAEHSQNNKIKVKKKRVKALGKLQYNLSNRDKKVDESSMISDARMLSDQDSNTCDAPKDNLKDYQEPIADSYFLPPSPIFTSSSDGFGAYNSIVYAKSDTNEVEDSSKLKSMEDVVLKEIEVNGKSSNTDKHLETSKISDQNKRENCNSKKVAKGHALLPKFVHTLGAPKMSRPNIRSWNPQSRNANAVDTCKEGSDPLEAILQEMDGVQVAQKEGGESSNTSSDTAQPVTSSPKNSKKYKVDLDKEIKSLTSTSSVNNEEKDKIVDEEVDNPESNNVQKEKECEMDKKLVGTDKKLKMKEDGNDASDSIKESSKVVSPKRKQKKASTSSDSKSEKKSSNAKETIDKEKKSHDESSDSEEKSCAEKSDAEESIDKGKKSHDESSDAEETIDKPKKSHDESETERELKRKKRKRDHSSGSESHESYHRKKKKKSHKRRKKYKKRKRRRDGRSESDDSDGESGKEDKDDEKGEKDKSDLSEGDDKEESGKPKKHKKRKKKSRHRKKSKYKRSKSKLRKKDRSHSQSASLSSSQDRSRSTSQHRSRSSSRYRSRSSSRHRSRSSNRHKSRSLSRHRSRSLSRHRSRSLSQLRNRSLSRHRSRSLSQHRSRSLSKESSKSPKKNSHSSRSCSTSQESVNQAARHRKDGKSRSQTTSDTVTSSKKDQENVFQISMPMPIDPSKIKVEKEDIPKNVSVTVPDLSIVKTEKEDRPSLPSTSIKIEKSDMQSETIESLNSTNKSKNSSNEKTKLSSITGMVEKSSSHHEESKDLSNVGMKKDSSSHQKLSKEVNLQAKEKEHKRASIAKERRKSNGDRRNSTENISNRKSSRQDSTDVRKGEKEHNSQKASVNERRGSAEKIKGVTVSEKRGGTEKNKGVNMSERRGSTEKNKDNTNMSRSSNQDSQPNGLSMFDMVVASIDPSKPRALTEISLFDNIAAIGYESSSDTSPPSDLDEESLSQENKDEDKSSNQPSTIHPSNNQKKSSSHSTSRDKHSSGSKPDKVRSPTKSEKDKQSHKSSTNHSKLKSHRESESDSKHAHSSSSKQKTSSRHSSSSCHKISSSSHKTSSNTSKELNNCDDKTNHSSSSKNKEVKSSSHVGKQDYKNHSSKSNHDRKHSVGNHEKEKEHSSMIHKSREHSKKSSGKEKEHVSGNHGKGKESGSKDGLDSEKDPNKSGSHEKLKESSKNRHDKEKERSNKKESIMKDKLKMEENEVSSSSERELYAANDDDEEEDSNSSFPDLSVLDEIPQDDWEQMINPSGREDLKHLENLRTEEDFDLDDLDKDDPDVMEECLQMYNDYKPDPADVEHQSSSKKKMRVEPKDESELLPSKQRIARASGGNMLATKPSAAPKNRKKTPAQVMMERYQKLKEQQAELLKKLERQKQQLEEQGRGVAAAASSSTVSSSTSSRSKHAVVSSSNVSSTTSSRSKIAPASSSTSLKSSPHSTSGPAPKRRMSHVPNVSSLLQERERIKNLPPSNSKSLLSPNVASASGSAPQTIAHTVTKGGRRFAHVPQLETLQRPTIAAEFGSKVPPNIRQRYLNSLIDECLKFLGEKEAFNLGMAEERVCFQRASSRMVYLNLAVNSVKRLRNQQEAGEAAQELMESDPMFKETSFIEEPSTSEMPSTSGISASPSKEVKPHPINPNHSRFSHFSVLAVGGQRGTWSIEKSKKSTVNVQNYLKGSNFYKYLKKYLLADKQLGENGYPSPDPEEKGKAVLKGVDTRKKISPSLVERYCDRCSVLYTVDKWGFPLSIGPCVHHWGRPYKRRGYSGMETRYSCCGGDLESDGCCQATTHVSQNYNPNELRGYVRTLPKDVKNNDYGVYALDCEMCYTTAGNELTRVTVVDTEGKTVYEQLVKPENPIIDYNTRFSGITESDMEDVKTTIRDVQAAMLTRFCDKTILIGHSLESDFHALKLIHDTVVDTSVVFPHKMGAPFKRALKNLASEYLKKIIQNDVSGHDSAEDAITCMHLMHWRIKEDLKGFGQK